VLTHTLSERRQRQRQGARRDRQGAWYVDTIIIRIVNATARQFGACIQ
jgi:hypothetical protein